MALRKIAPRRSRKAGLPPGALVHIGEKKLESVRISLMDYSEGQFFEKEIGKIEECFPFKDSATVTWIDIDGLHRPEIIESVGTHFGIHPLVLEDLMATDQRPKMEDYGDYLFIVLKMMDYLENKPDIIFEQVSLILGPNFLITFQEGKEGDVFGTVRERIRGDRGRIRKMGSDHLAYALMDAVVDRYFVILERYGEMIETLEEELVGRPEGRTLQTIHTLKTDMLFLRRSVWPLREVLGGMERGESGLITPATRLYVRDIYDHVIQIMDTIETYREMLSGMLDIYLSSINNRISEVMKTLTIITTIFIPLSFIAGVYGMNFKFMPELDRPWGYPLILTVMGAIGLSLLAFFKRKKWF